MRAKKAKIKGLAAINRKRAIRRSLLLAIVMGPCAAVFADGPSTNPYFSQPSQPRHPVVQHRPSMRIVSSPRMGEVRANPFVQPTPQQAPPSRVQLTSGNEKNAHLRRHQGVAPLSEIRGPNASGMRPLNSPAQLSQFPTASRRVADARPLTQTDQAEFAPLNSGAPHDRFHPGTASTANQRGTSAVGDAMVVPAGSPTGVETDGKPVWFSFADNQASAPATKTSSGISSPEADKQISNSNAPNAVADSQVAHSEVTPNGEPETQQQTQTGKVSTENVGPPAGVVDEKTSSGSQEASANDVGEPVAKAKQEIEPGNEPAPEHPASTDQAGDAGMEESTTQGSTASEENVGAAESSGTNSSAKLEENARVPATVAGSPVQLAPAIALPQPFDPSETLPQKHTGPIVRTNPKVSEEQESLDDVPDLQPIRPDTPTLSPSGIVFSLNDDGKTAAGETAKSQIATASDAPDSRPAGVIANHSNPASKAEPTRDADPASMDSESGLKEVASPVAVAEAAQPSAPQPQKLSADTALPADSSETVAVEPDTTNAESSLTAAEPLQTPKWVPQETELKKFTEPADAKPQSTTMVSGQSQKSAQRIEVFQFESTPLSRQRVAVAPPPLQIEREQEGQLGSSPAAQEVLDNPMHLAKEVRPSVPKIAAAAKARKPLSSLPQGSPLSKKQEAVDPASSTKPKRSAGVSIEFPHVAAVAESDDSQVVQVAPAISPESPIAKIAERSDSSERAVATPKAAVTNNAPARVESLPVQSQKSVLTSAPPVVAETPKKSSKGKREIILNLTRAQVRSMTIGGTLRKVAIGDNDICQAFAAGANQIKLIGTGIGRTQLVVWADVRPDEPTRMQTFTIDVNEAVNATGAKVTENIDLLNTSIDTAFPRASVVVSRDRGTVVVTGRCDSEEEAKQIIRMVRKSCLVPVRDGLKVR